MRTLICLSLMLLSLQSNLALASQNQLEGIFLEQTKSVTVQASSESNAILKAEDNNPDVELAKLYPDNQTVKYEPMKRAGFALNFGERI